MNILRHIYFPVFLIALCACTADDFRDSTIVAESLSVRFSQSNQQNAGGLSSEIDNISAFRFEDNILKEIVSNININDEGVADINLASMNGNLFFLANAGKIIEENDFQVGNTMEDDFLSIKSDVDGMNHRGITMTGKLSFAGEGKDNLEVAIRHSVARIDLASYSVDAKVNSVKIKDVMERPIKRKEKPKIYLIKTILLRISVTLHFLTAKRQFSTCLSSLETDSRLKFL